MYFFIIKMCEESIIVEIIKLEKAKKNLELVVVNERGWTEVSYIEKDKTFLGAEMLDTIIESLELPLRKNNFPKTTSILEDKKEISRLIALSETFCTIYASKNNSGIEYLFHKDGKFIANILLSEQECNEWYSILQQNHSI